MWRSWHHSGYQNSSSVPCLRVFEVVKVSLFPPWRIFFFWRLSFRWTEPALLSNHHSVLSQYMQRRSIRIDWIGRASIALSPPTLPHLSRDSLSRSCFADANMVEFRQAFGSWFLKLPWVGYPKNAKSSNGVLESWMGALSFLIPVVAWTDSHSPSKRLEWLSETLTSNRQETSTKILHASSSSGCLTLQVVASTTFLPSCDLFFVAVSPSHAAILS